MMTNKKQSLRVSSSTRSAWPVLDGDPRWEEKLDAQLSRLRTRLQRKLGAAKGAKKAALVAQLRDLREDFQKEHDRLAETEKSGAYVVTKSTRRRRSTNATTSAAEMVGAALGKVIALLDTWKANTSQPAKANRARVTHRRAL
jgi:hypothetical protein